MQQSHHATQHQQQQPGEGAGNEASHAMNTQSSNSSYVSSRVRDAPLLDANLSVLDRPFVLPDSLSAVELSRSVECDVYCMISTPAPVGRADLEHAATTLTEGRLRILLHNANSNTPRCRFPDDADGAQQWEDAVAVALYTDNSAVYRIVNGYLSAPNLTLRDVLPVAPIVRRMYQAVQRIGTRYAGPAYRVLKACKTAGSEAMRSAYNNYNKEFAVGQPIDIQQFASFTKAASTVNAFAKKHSSPVIVLSCGTIDGFDISRYSMVPSEGEVLCLPPARFVVSIPPIKIGTTVVVGVETMAAAQRRHRTNVSLQFASSLGAGTVAASVANPNDPQVARSALLDDVEAELRNKMQRCILYGPKGVGKTHLAFQLGQRWLARGGDARGHHMRWFSAGSHELLLAGYHTFVQDCAGGAPIDGRSMPELKRAMQRLVASTPNVLFVFDGVEDEAVVEKMLCSLFPMTGQPVGVSVLMTSTSCSICETGAWAALEGHHRKEIPVFTDTEVSSYLTQALSHSLIAAARLQGTPLFQTHVHNHPKRLQWVAALLRNKPDMTIDELESCVARSVATNAVDPVFTVVVDALIAECSVSHTKGWEMLRLAATLADAPIPVTLLCRCMAITEDQADDAIQCLTLFSLAALTFPVGRPGEASVPCVVVHSLAREEATRYSMHYSVSEHCEDDSRLPLSTTIVGKLADLFPSASYWLAQLYYPHALQITTLPCTPNDSTHQSCHHAASARLLRHMASHMSYMGNNSIALEHTVHELNHNRRLYQSEEHSAIAVSLSDIGCYYSALGDQKQALRYGLEALEMERKVLPDNHPDIVVSLSNIGGYYSALGDQEEALKYGLEALEMERKVLPEQHRNIAVSLSDIGGYYSALGDQKKALKYGLWALEMRRKVLPEHHRDVAVSMCNIGTYYSALGDQKEALKYGLEALEMQRKVFPEQHRDVAVSLSKVGGYYRALGDQKKALKYGLEALEMRRKVLPEQHRDVAVSLCNIGGYYSALGDQEEALRYGLEALEMERKVLPEQHRNIAVSLSDIGGYYSALGDQTQALKYGLEALEMRRKVLPEQHRDVAVSLCNIGGYYSALGDQEKALAYGVEALAIQRKVLPEQHRDVAVSLSKIGGYYSALGDQKQALKYGLEALEMQRKVLPEQHPHIAASLCTIGSYFSVLGNQTQALKNGLEALEMERKVLPEQHRNIAVSLCSIGGYYSALGDQAQALRYGLEALEMRRKVLPEHHPDIAVSLCSIGGYYSVLGDQKRALRYGLEALRLRRKVLPGEHPHIAVSLSKVGGYYSALGDQAQALKYGLEALEMQRKVLPAQHRDVAVSLSKVGGYYSALGDPKKALRYGLEALGMQRNVLPEQHPHIAVSLSNIGGYYSVLGNKRLALKNGLEALEIERKVLPEQHPRIAVSLCHIGGYYSALGDQAQALKYGLEAREMRTRCSQNSTGTSR